MNGSRAWFEKDFYKVLGVGENASADEIKRVYKKLARQYHPDRNPGDKQAEEKMKDVSEAYEVLSDTKKRGEYDQVRRMARGGYGAGFGGSGGRAGNVRFEGVPFDLGDMFGGIFGGARGAGRRGQSRAAHRGADLETSIRIPFEDSIRGTTVSIPLRRTAPCSACGGSGDRSGTARQCPTCGGSGAIHEDQGMFAFERTCPDCGGSGRVVSDPCPQCGGSGVEQRTEQARVRIPAGVRDGARIRVRGKGEAAPGGRAGDLYVRVGVEPHPVFGRKGDDLTVTVPMSFAALALGAEVPVPTLDGTVTLRIPPGTQPGRAFRVRGKGVERANARGDLLATVQVQVPKTLTAEERELIERLAALQAGGAGANGHARADGSPAPAGEEQKTQPSGDEHEKEGSKA